MINFLHAADLHLDSPFASRTPEQAAQSRQAQRRMLEQLAETCQARSCQLLLLSGDLFDSAHVYRETLDALTDALARCKARVFIAPGNHDCLSPASPYLTLSWPENVHIFTSPTPQAVCLEDLGCRVWGAAFTGPTSPSLLEGFSIPRQDYTEIMVLHGDAGNPNSDYNPITDGQLSASGLDYLALGHIHLAGRRRQGKTLCAWPGCLMGRGFDETGDKGAYLGAIAGREITLQFLPLARQRYQQLTLPVGDDPLTAILDKLPEDTAQDTYRIFLTGESNGLDLPSLYAALSSRFYHLELQDRTTPTRDLWQALGEDTLKGSFLRQLKPQYDADPALRESIAYGVRTTLALMEEREVPPL